MSEQNDQIRKFFAAFIPQMSLPVENDSLFNTTFKILAWPKPAGFVHHPGKSGTNAAGTVINHRLADVHAFIRKQAF
ncbi:MAG: hypothetical protein R2874_06960 [Desulfobacterales bacterium]